MLHCQKDKFSIDEGIHYLNCAYMSPLLKDVEEVGIKGIQSKRNPFTVKPADFFYESDLLRKEFSTLIKNDFPERVVIIPSVSYGISMIARNIDIKKEQKIVLAANQFPSNVYPWLRLAQDRNANVKFIEKPDFFETNSSWSKAIIQSIDENVKIVSLSHTHWADGTKFDLEAIRNRCDEVGAYLVIDGTQSIGALPFDIQKIRPDALICAGYKWLMGPYSSGLAYIGERLLDGIPLEENWINRLNSENFAGLVDYENNYQKGALRYEVGEHSNFILVPMLLAAVRQINDWGTDNIISYAQGLADLALDRLSSMGFLYNEKDSMSPHLFGISHSKMDMEKLNGELAARNIFVSIRGKSLRISLNVYNTEEDVFALLKAFEKVV